MRRSNLNLGVLVLASSLVPLVGCTKKVSATSDEARQSPEGKACPTNIGVISDGEANSNQINTIKGRGGYWYTFLDKEGSSVTPQAGALGGTFEMAPGG